MTASDRVRAFLKSWLTVIASLAIAPFLIAVALELWILARAEWDGGEAYAHPMLFGVFWSILGAVAGVMLGWPFALLRRYLVQPEIPFLGPGYPVLSAIPFVIGAVFTHRTEGWFWLPVYSQVLLLTTTLVYVALAHHFRLFEQEDPTWWRGR